MIKSFSVFIPVIDETISILKTINILESENSSKILEYIIVISKKKTKLSSLLFLKIIKKNYKKKINIIYQDDDFFGGALKKAIKEFKGNHFLMMASDLETNPKDVKFLIRSSSIVEKKIICTSRWIRKNSFKNYNLVKLICNKIFQVLARILFFTKLTDLTYGFRVYPRSYIKKIKLLEKKHPIMLEAILIPI